MSLRTELHCNELNCARQQQQQQSSAASFLPRSGFLSPDDARVTRLSSVLSNVTSVESRKDADLLEQATLLTLPQLAETVGVEYRTLHSWLRRGLLEPSLQRSSGTGVPNLFSLQDAVKTKIIVELRQAGLSFEMLNQASARLGERPDALTDGAMVLVNGSVTIASTREAIAMITHEALTLVYNTRPAIEAIASSVADRPAHTR